MRTFSFSRCETGGGALRRFGGSAGPRGRLPCGARDRGPAVELASRPLGAALRQRRRVGSRSALRARAPTPALLGDPQARRGTPPPASRNLQDLPVRSDPIPLATAGAWGQGRWERREAQWPGWRAQRASKTDPPSLSERSGQRSRSEFDGATRPRASQRSRPYGRPPRRPCPQAPAAARRTQTRQVRQTRRASKVLKTDQST